MPRAPEIKGFQAMFSASLGGTAIGNAGMPNQNSLLSRKLHNPKIKA